MEGLTKLETMAYGLVRPYSVVAHGSTNPTDAEWTRYWSDFETANKRAMIQALLVYSEGGGPNAKQRQQLSTLFGQRAQRPPIAILSDAPVARMITTAISWVVKNRLRIFDPNDYEGAFAFIGLTSPPEQDAVRIGLNTLKRQLGLGVARGRELR